MQAESSWCGRLEGLKYTDADDIHISVQQIIVSGNGAMLPTLDICLEKMKETSVQASAVGGSHMWARTGPWPGESALGLFQLLILSEKLKPDQTTFL